MSHRPYLAIVGGFLGAGKTTLILAAARELEKRKLRVAIVMNDQGDALVDTESARRSGLPSGEVTGGCFCCRFSELIAVTERLREWSPDVIFAEPVGSCADISATILRPILQSYRDAFHLLPYTVLVDPARARDLLGTDSNHHLAFLFRKQLEEADIVCYTKSDISTRTDLSGMAAVRTVSARTGQGVTAWLDELLSGRLLVGGTLLDIDYEEYARAEAALAWLNAQVTIECAPALSPSLVLGPLFDALDRRMTAAGLEIVHFKAVDETSTGFVKLAVSRTGEGPNVEGGLDASPATTHSLLVNLRAVAEPGPLQQLFEEELQSLGGKLIDLSIRCFSPAAPNPERRVLK